MIKARIIADSISLAGKRITTFEIEYPRFIHAEFMTHRMFSKNGASSRAIPLSVSLSSVWNNPANPVHWGLNQSGMVAKEELKGFKKLAAKKIWKWSGRAACVFAWLLGKTGVHKQIANRILEPWSHMKLVVTATDWNNFWALRTHPDAQPEFRTLALTMRAEYLLSTPTRLQDGEWHLPYITPKDRLVHPIDVLLKVSASMCAQVSYRKADDSVKKALGIYKRLVDSRPVHASPFEHQAMALVDGDFRSNNFTGWKQFRSMITDNVVSG